MGRKEKPLERIDDLLARLLARVVQLTPERVAVKDEAVGALIGRTLAAPLRAEVDHPSSDVSAMDGWAVRSADLEVASADRPCVLRCVGDSAAGAHVPATLLGKGECRRVATGATIPPGADAVIPVERSSLTNPRDGGALLERVPGELPERVWLTAPSQPGAHIRRRGEDLHVGDELAPAGSLIDAALLSAIFTSGVDHLELVQRPRVAILTSGDELSAAASAGGVRDSNGPALAALVLSEGGELVARARVSDDAAATRAAVERLAAECDVLVTTGGVSVGAHDHVGAALEGCFEILVWRLAIQPGKPILLGQRRAGERGAAWALGIPGNPVSAFVIGVEILLPLLRALSGRAPYGISEVGVMETTVQSPVGRRSFLRLSAVRNADGEPLRDDVGRLRVRLAGGQGSHQASVLAETDYLGVVPEAIGELAAGSTIELHPLSRAARRI